VDAKFQSMTEKVCMHVPPYILVWLHWNHQQKEVSSLLEHKQQETLITIMHFFLCWRRFHLFWNTDSKKP
jgi:hypothetical protein